jgi:hypothetical protein
VAAVTEALRWGEADSDPLADIQRWRDEVAASDFRPHTIWMPERVWRRILRRMTTKRQYRRLRGKMKQARRLNHGSRIDD